MRWSPKAGRPVIRTWRRTLHAGVVVLEDGGLRRDEQHEVICRVLELIVRSSDMVNRVVTVSLDGGLTLKEVPEPEQGE